MTWVSQRVPDISSSPSSLSNTFSWMLLDRLVTMVSSLLVGVYMVRVLGPSLFGSYSYALAFYSIFQVAFLWGLESLMVRDLIRQPQQIEEILGMAFLIHHAGALLAMVLLCGTAVLMAPPIIAPLMFCLGCAYPFASWRLLDAQYQVSRKRHRLAQVRIMVTVMGALIKAGLLTLHFEIWTLGAWMALENLSLCLLLKFIHGDSPWKHRSWSSVRARAWIGEGWPLLVQSLLFMLISRVDQVMIEQHMGVEALGEYVMGRKLPDAWCFIPGLWLITVYPRIEEGKGRSQLWSDAMRNLIWMCSSVALLFVFCHERVFLWLYGGWGGAGSVVMMIQFFTVVFTAISMLGSRYLLSQSKSHHLLLRSSVGLMINVGLNMVWIPAFGIVGAACATLISQFYVGVVSCCWFSSTRPLLGIILGVLRR